MRYGCDIQQVGKSRNGKPRFWCRAHGASATGRYGSRLEKCEAAYRVAAFDDVFDLEEKLYAGGVALWGAVAPVYDTSGRKPEAGIHVHAREVLGGPKVIDRTYAAVSMAYDKTLFGER